MAGPARYYSHSTAILHAATIVYLSLVLGLPRVTIVSLVFSSLYTLQALWKFIFEGQVYRSTYYGLGFRLIDLLAGPISAVLCIWKLAMQRQQGLDLICGFVLMKIATCSSYIVLLKQISHVVRSASFYLRLSLQLALCFTTMSYFLFQHYSKFWMDLGSSFFSIYQISTFDGWNVEPVKDIRDLYSNLWLLYFFVYALLMCLVYLATMMSFFVIYTSTKELQLDFTFKPGGHVTVSQMAKILHLKLVGIERGKSLRHTEVYLFACTVWAAIESYMPWTISYRTIPLSLMMLAGLITFYHHIRELDASGESCVVVLRAFLPLLALIVCVMADTRLSIPFACFTAICVFDLVRNNSLIMLLFTKKLDMIVEYIVILVASCYLMAMIIYRQPELLQLEGLQPKIASLLDAFLLNVEIIGFDGWGDIAHQVLRSQPIWTLYFILIVFLLGFLVVNVFMGEVLEAISPAVAQELRISKLMHTSLYYDKGLNNLAHNCLTVLSAKGFNPKI